jgi:hypothetical protein
MKMLKKKKSKPAIEVGVNLGGLLEKLGLETTADKVLSLIQEGKLEVKVEFSAKGKGKTPASISVRLKKAEK